MKLLLDVGNSRAKWAWLDAGELADCAAVAHDGRIVNAVISALSGLDREPEEVLLASVAGPAVTAELTDALRNVLKVPVCVARSEAAAAGVRNGYVDPQQLGVDRWLAILAAFARYRSALCVVDSGTALTIDAVSGSGVHQGGLIMPGFALVRDALNARTGEIAKSGRVLSAPDAGSRFWGRDTEGCIRRGAAAAADGLIGLCVAELSRSAGSPVKLVLTGGDADKLRDGLSQPADICPFLVLEGLALRYGGD